MSPDDISLGERAAALKAWLDAKPGAHATAPPGPGRRAPTALIYKVAGKMFAILGIR